MLILNFFVSSSWFFENWAPNHLLTYLLVCRYRRCAMCQTQSVGRRSASCWESLSCALPQRSSLADS